MYNYLKFLFKMCQNIQNCIQLSGSNIFSEFTQQTRNKSIQTGTGQLWRATWSPLRHQLVKMARIWLMASQHLSQQQYIIIRHSMHTNVTADDWQNKIQYKQTTKTRFMTIYQDNLDEMTSESLKKIHRSLCINLHIQTYHPHLYQVVVDQTISNVP